MPLNQMKLAEIKILSFSSALVKSIWGQERKIMDTYNKIKVESERILKFWQDPQGWAPDSVALILSIARLDWLIGLTNTLSIWINLEEEYDAGELLLANANIGALVEGWLKLFYCVYFEDYQKKLIRKKVEW